MKRKFSGNLTPLLILLWAKHAYPGSSCWFQRGRCFPASPRWGRWWFLDFCPAILWLPAALRHHPFAASSRCHADLGRSHAIHRCQGDRWAGLDCSHHHRGCRRHREGPGRSSMGKGGHEVYKFDFRCLVWDWKKKNKNFRFEPF